VEHVLHTFEGPQLRLRTLVLASVVVRSRLERPHRCRVVLPRLRELVVPGRQLGQLADERLHVLLHALERGGVRAPLRIAKVCAHPPLVLKGIAARLKCVDLLALLVQVPLRELLGGARLVELAPQGAHGLALLLSALGRDVSTVQHS
jgi:hypothetical protein